MKKTGDEKSRDTVPLMTPFIILDFVPWGRDESLSSSDSDCNRPSYRGTRTVRVHVTSDTCAFSNNPRKFMIQVFFAAQDLIDY
jgi:hypothetical protein